MESSGSGRDEPADGTYAALEHCSNLLRDPCLQRSSTERLPKQVASTWCLVNKEQCQEQRVERCPRHRAFPSECMESSDLQRDDLPSEIAQVANSCGGLPKDRFFLLRSRRRRENVRRNEASVGGEQEREVKAARGTIGATRRAACSSVARRG